VNFKLFFPSMFTGTQRTNTPDVLREERKRRQVDEVGQELNKERNPGPRRQRDDRKTHIKLKSAARAHSLP